MKNHPKTRLWNLSQMLSWFQDWGKIFQDPRLLRNQTTPLELLRGILFIDLHITITSWLVANTVFIRLTDVGTYIKFLDLENGRLFEVGTYSRLGAY